MSNKFEEGFANFGAALAELRQLETGWGGTTTVIGSPQGQGSRLSVEEVLEVVQKHLR